MLYLNSSLERKVNVLQRNWTEPNNNEVVIV